MPSRTERLLRGGALIALGITLARLLVAAGAEPTHHHDRWEAAPAARVRDSLAAMARSGERVSWSGPVSAIAAMAEAVREPRPAVRVSVVADSFAVVADTLGALDSLGAGGGTLTLAAGGEDALAMHATERGTRAGVTTVTADEPRRILVIGRAGWEAKFVVAALEESGWHVDARLRLSDSMSVAQGSAAAPTLATHAAVIVLDTALAAQGAAITRFVRAGGGLVLSGEAVRAPAFAAILPARGGRLLAPLQRSFEDGDPLDGLALIALASPRADAIALESRGGATAITARRESAGRVIQSGFAETWRWRMEGGPGSVAAHREWWSRLVALAIPTSAAAPRAAADEGAPLAALTASLGSPIEPPSRSGPRAPLLPLWLTTFVLLALLAEWALRRTRGVA